MGTSEVPNRDPAIAQFVRVRRKANKLNQYQLAELAGVGKRFLIELEAGKPTLRMDAVNKVLAVFGKTLGVVGTAPDNTTEAQGTMDETRAPQVTGRRGIVRLDGRQAGLIEETNTG